MGDSKALIGTFERVEGRVTTTIRRGRGRVRKFRSLRAGTTTPSEAREREWKEIEEEGQYEVRPSLFHHPREMLIRRPLQSHWTLWYLEADRNKEWEDCLKCVSLFDTVVDSYALYNGMPMG
ncbi:hypothetical protein PRIPAC_73886 [Pristionchus pacificus]|uniref:Uncharacterized protein n=1 Tax=Pristionchus pacificus TaxID=54126 RepID=A0A2A6CA96_PRIPA|nr:hypothetical protein PRIPAC_73886 [Pristionchus pacificus]|eukprot:PDM74951.1 hypothetical protein PRIPAC_40332 [Pristionchus pacificus]